MKTKHTRKLNVITVITAIICALTCNVYATTYTSGNGVASVWKSVMNLTEDETKTNYLQNTGRGLTGLSSLFNAANNMNTKQADIAVREFISEINGIKLTGDQSREPKINTAQLNKTTNGQKQTTATYNHTKQPLIAQIGDKVVYTIRIYNEGDIPTYVKQVQQYFPTYISYVETDDSIAYWQASDEMGCILQSTEYCEIVGAGGQLNFDDIQDKRLGNVLIPAVTKNTNATLEENTYIVSYVDVQITGEIMRVTPYDTDITTLVELTSMTDENGRNITDCDSLENDIVIPTNDELKTYKKDEQGKRYIPGQEDDDDFEKITVAQETLDLSLRRYIRSINEETFDRAPTVDTAALQMGTTTTATYKHSKDILEAHEGDIITHTIRIYNEGDKIASVTRLTDYVSKGLELVSNTTQTQTDGANQTTAETQNAATNTTNALTTTTSDTTTEYGALTEQTQTNPIMPSETEMMELDPIAKSNQVIEPSIQWLEIEGEEYNTVISTNFLKVTGVGGNVSPTELGKNLKDVVIPAYDKENDVLSYVDVEIQYKVLPIEEKTNLTTIAEITKIINYNNEEIQKDKDSIPYSKFNNGNMLTAQELIEYKDAEIAEGQEYIHGYEDDDDFEKIFVSKQFDLRLKKFITKIDESKINNREPRVIFTDDGINYEATKAPIDVNPNDIVIYTIRIYNEGNADGYAEEITDSVPDGLEFVPSDEVNEKYEWKMIDANGDVTNEIDEAKYIVTDYLSESKESSDRQNEIKAFEPKTEETEAKLDYKDIQIAFKVTFVPQTEEDIDKMLINVAQISNASDKDIDSTPSRDEEYNRDVESEDDLDIEQVVVGHFDLAVQEWIDEAQVTVKGETTTIKGNEAAQLANESNMTIAIDENKINKAVVKFQYMIKVTNEGNIEGYATELKDYVPEGLKLEESDNIEWNWKTGEDGSITSDCLSKKLLKPGESVEVPVVLRWVNSKEQIGAKVNHAEISEYSNDSDAPIIKSLSSDSKDSEDISPIILAIRNAGMGVYVAVALVGACVVAGGAFAVKKFVLG